MEGMDRLIKRAGGGTQKKLEKRHKKRREERRREGERLRKGERELKRWRSGDRRGRPWSCPLYAFCGEHPVPGAAPEDPGMSSLGHPGGGKGTAGVPQRLYLEANYMPVPAKEIPGLSSLTLHASVSIFQPLKAQLGP